MDNVTNSIKIHIQAPTIITRVFEHVSWITQNRVDPSCRIYAAQNMDNRAREVAMRNLVAQHIRNLDEN